LQFGDASALSAAAAALRATVVDQRTLTLQVPNDGSVHAVRTLLRDVDRRSLPVTSLSVHTADLDDVFLALTGRSTATDTPRSDR
jgi:ABC-2 type transport system ATP-binding protein